MSISVNALDFHFYQAIAHQDPKYVATNDAFCTTASDWSLTYGAICVGRTDRMRAGQYSLREPNSHGNNPNLGWRR